MKIFTWIAGQASNHASHAKRFLMLMADLVPDSNDTRRFCVYVFQITKKVSRGGHLAGSKLRLDSNSRRR
jgi:hypothetical protein